MKQTNLSTRYIAQDEFANLRVFASMLHKKNSAQPSLFSELETATVLPRELLPPGVVTIDARVRAQDVRTDELEEFVVTWPDRADGGAGQVSVLAPIGRAVIGCRAGDEVACATPAGLRRLRLLDVEASTEAEELPENTTSGMIEQILSGVR